MAARGLVIDGQPVMNRQFLLMRRPQGEPVPDDFALAETPVAAAPAGGFVIRNHFASLDPAQRGWMDPVDTYMAPIPLGAPVRAMTVGRVHASDNPDYAPGDWVLGLNALEDYSVVDTSRADLLVRDGGFTRKLDVSIVPSPTMFLSGFGAVGLTGYFGVLEALKPRAGETMLVSGAAGAVGSIVGQIGRMQGCHMIGIAGGAEKCRRLTADFGYDVAIDYKGKSQRALIAEIGKAAPGGIDMIFENVGGDILDAGIMNIAQRGRILLSGLISEYNHLGSAGARNLWMLIVRQASMTGFLVTDYIERYDEAGRRMAQWFAEGKVKVEEDIQPGLENAYTAFMRLFTGANTGKLILKIANREQEEQ